MKNEARPSGILAKLAGQTMFVALLATIVSAGAAVAPDKFGNWPQQLAKDANLYSFARHPNGDIYGAGNFRFNFTFGSVGSVNTSGGDEGWVGAFSWDGVAKRRFTFKNGTLGAPVSATGIVADQNSGDVYVCGLWQEALEVEDGVGGFVSGFTSSGTTAQFFLAKFAGGTSVSAAQGGWVTTVGKNASAGPPYWSTTGFQTRGMAVDGQGNIYVVGYCRAGTRFDSASGSGGSNITRNDVAGNDTGFLAKYLPSGRLDWVRLLDSPGNSDVATAVAVDANDRVFVAGFFESSNLTLESDTTQTAGSLGIGSNGERLYVAEYSVGGRHLNHWRFGGDAGNASSQQKVGNMVIDGQKIVVCGWHQGNLRRPNGSIWTGGGNGGARAGYAAAFDKSGNPMWARTLAIDSGGENDVHDVAIDETGDVLVAGLSSQAVGSPIYYGSLDAFLGKLSGGSGGTLWMEGLGAGGADRGFAVLAAPGRQVITGGHYANDINWKGSQLIGITPDNVQIGHVLGFSEGPPNDLFENSINLGGAVVTNGSTANYNATADPGEPAHAGRSASRSVWWKWTAAKTGQVRLSTAGSTALDPGGDLSNPVGMNTLLAVYTGTAPGGLTPVASNDDANAGAFILTSEIVFNVQAGTQYQIAVDGKEPQFTVNGGPNPGVGIVKLALEFNELPTVSVGASPTAITLGQSVTLNAIASDPDGTISNVQFYDGGTFIGSDSTFPYSLSTTSLPGGLRSITAVATDNKGATTTSAAVSVDVNVPPTVILSSTPTAITLGQSVALNATAADSDGTIAKVEFFDGGTKLGEDMTLPYSLSTTSLPAGLRSLTAVATDNKGATTTSTAVMVDVNVPPNVSLSATPTAITLGQSVTLNSTAADSDGTIAKVEFFDGNTKLGEDTSAPYSLAITSLPAGLRSLTAVATDNKGASTTSSAVTVDVNVPPTVSLSATPTATTLGQSVTLNSTAADSDGTIVKVEFFDGGTKLGEDTSAPYSLVTTSLPAGMRSVTAVATDNKGAATISSAVTVDVNVPPTVSLSATPTAITLGQSVTLSATAADSDGTIAKVEFFDGATKLGEDATAPYSLATTSLPAGLRSITAVATDNKGATTTSAAVTVDVNVPPTVSLSSTPTAITLGQSVTLNATAADSDGTVVKVEFFDGNAKLGEDTSAPYSLVTASLPAGLRSLTAVATDNKGASTTSAAINIIVTQPGLTFTAGNASGARNSAVSIPITVEMFTNIVTLQGSLHWNSAIAEFVGWDAADLPSLNNGNFNTNSTAAGSMTFSWDDPNVTGVTLADGKVLFRLRFNLKGNAGQSTGITLDGTPLAFEVTQNNGAGGSPLVVPATLRAGQINIENNFIINGSTLYYASGLGVPQATVTVSGGANSAASTATDGSYQFSVPVGGNYTVATTRAGDAPANQGVTTLDITLIRRHILGSGPLDSPFKIIAADANNSSSVSTLDITLIRRLILGIDTALSGGSWRFVPTSHQFTDLQNPWGYPQSRSYSNLNADQPGQNYTAVKVGDVNNSWTVVGQLQTTAMASGTQPVRKLNVAAAQSVTFSASPATPAPSTRFKVNISVAGFAAVTTAQFTLDWNPAVISYVGTGDYGLNGLAGGNYGVNNTGTGKLTFSWDDPNAVGVAVADGTVIFSVEFDVVGAAGSSTSVSFGNSPTPQEVTVNFNPTTLNAQSGTVTVSGGPQNQAPTVTLAATPATVNLGQTVTLTVTASDSDGTVAKVEFFDGTTKLGEDTASPFTLAVNSLGVGTHSLTARATDNGGLATTSTAVSVTVNTPPQNGVTFSAGSATPAPGSRFKVNISVAGFAAVTTAQFTLDWNPAVISYVGTGDYGLNGLAGANFGVNNTGTGKLTFSWDDPNAAGVTVVDGITIFSVEFDAAGVAGSSTSVNFGNSPTPQEVTVNLVSKPFVGQPGTINIGGGLVIEALSANTPVSVRTTGFSLSISGEPGRTYRLQVSTDLSNPPGWTDLTTFTGGSQAFQFVDDAATNRVRGFYRVVSP